MATPESTTAPPTSWAITRLHASLEAGLAVHQTYGPMGRVLNDLFLQQRPDTPLGGWMVKRQTSLREPQTGATPPSDSDSEAEGGDESLLSYGGGPVVPGRRKAKDPDFVVAKATSSLTGDVHHLYVEMKPGDVSAGMFAAQMTRYLRLATRAIPPTMNQPVYFMLVNGLDTFLWTLKRGAATPEATNIFLLAEVTPTLGERWWELVNGIADRV